MEPVSKSAARAQAPNASAADDARIPATPDGSAAANGAVARTPDQAPATDPAARIRAEAGSVRSGAPASGLRPSRTDLETAPIRIRLADDDDADGILAVYAPYVATAVTFEETVPAPDAFRARIAGIRATHPFLVAERSGKIVGYAHAAAQHTRAAYRWNAELSVYLAPDICGRGVGRALYEALLDLVRAQGLKAAYALVTVTNVASERLHAELGFERIGLQPNAGWKAGAWRDVAWLRKELDGFSDDPEPPTPFPALARARPHTVRAALDRANAALAARASGKRASGEAPHDDIDTTPSERGAAGRR